MNVARLEHTSLEAFLLNPFRVEPEAKMSAELLLELPSKVVKVFALPQAPGASFQKSALVIVQTDSVSVAHVRQLFLHLTLLRLLTNLHKPGFSCTGRERQSVPSLQLWQKNQLWCNYRLRLLVPPKVSVGFVVTLPHDAF